MLSPSVTVVFAFVTTPSTYVLLVASVPLDGGLITVTELNVGVSDILTFT